MVFTTEKPKYGLGQQNWSRCSWRKAACARGASDRGGFSPYLPTAASLWSTYTDHWSYVWFGVALSNILLDVSSVPHLSE